MNERKEMLIHDFSESEIISECDICGSLNKINHNTKVPHIYEDGECQEHGCDEYWIHDTGDEMENCECYYAEQSGSVCNCGAREMIDMHTGTSTFLNGEGAVAPTWDIACKCLDTPGNGALYDDDLKWLDDDEAPTTKDRYDPYHYHKQQIVDKKPEHCTLCNKELTDDTSRERGVGHTCYSKFSQKILVLRSNEISIEDVAILLEEKGFDFVFHDHGDLKRFDTIYHSIDEAPYIEKLSKDSKKLEDFALRFGLREENNQIGLPTGIKMWGDYENLCKLHNFIEEPEWMVMFDGSVNAQTIRPSISDEYEWQEHYAEYIDDQLDIYGGGRNDGLRYDIITIIDKVLGSDLGDIALDIMDKSPFIDRLNENFWEGIWENKPIVGNIHNPYYIDGLVKKGLKTNKLNPFEGALTLARSRAEQSKTQEDYRIVNALENYDQISGFYTSIEKAIKNCIIRELNLTNSDEN